MGGLRKPHVIIGSLVVFLLSACVSSNRANSANDVVIGSSGLDMHGATCITFVNNHTQTTQRKCFEHSSAEITLMLSYINNHNRPDCSQ